MAKAATPMDALVGSRLRSRRKQLRISQERLGKEVGVSFQQVQKYENGTNRIGAGRLAEISKVLDVPVAYFFTGNSGNPSSEGERADAKAILSEPGATELLQAYAQIGSLALRSAVVRLARDLAGNFGDGTGMAKRPLPRHVASSKLNP
jgi:transcriptional regulator with XRE-family HTH domain